VDGITEKSNERAGNFKRMGAAIGLLGLKRGYLTLCRPSQLVPPAWFQYSRAIS
jgi:hypothetical protein